MKAQKSNGAQPRARPELGFERKLWEAADALRNNMDAAEYKHVVLGQLINLVSDVVFGSPADRAKDILGRVYEYFLAQFASAEGKKGGQFYTPSRVVRVLVEMLAPYRGRVYDPCCGSGGMFDSSEKFIVAKIAGAYHAWHGDEGAGEYTDVPGFCKAAELDDNRKHGHGLTSGRYVGAAEVEDDGEPFEEKMRRLTATLREQQAEAAKLDTAIATDLKELGYGG